MAARADRKLTTVGTGPGTAALRRPDSVQCLVLVRDDFWMAISRFMEATGRSHPGRAQQRLGGPVRPATTHARCWPLLAKRTAGFPRTTASCPRNSGRFLERAVDELAEDGKVICVRLALFADMFKGKPWTPAELKDVRRHGRCGRDISGRDIQRHDGPPAASATPEGGAGGVGRLAARDAGPSIKGQDAVPRRAAWRLPVSRNVADEVSSS